MENTTNRDEVFRDPADKSGETWRVRFDGKILTTTWNSKGAALAGLYTERQRVKAKAMSRLREALS